MSAIANSNQPEDKPKTSRVQSYWRNIPWKKLSSLVMAIALCFYLTACGGDNQSASKDPAQKVDSIATNIVEVSPPTEIQRLSRLLDRYDPQVSIVSPKPDEVLNSDQVAVKFDVKNLPIFKNSDFGLGPHIHVTLDNQEYKALYDLSQTVAFENLAPGTHTIRAFASRPWHESFKNKGAYAQVSFNVLTKTGENTPDPKTPLLTYSRPVGTYGAEPVMLDFYIQNAPLHLLGKDEPSIDDWQVRATVNGQSFTFDRWEPIYLKGLKSGKNWVKLELLEDDGDAIPNVFNSTAHVINFQPNGSDTLSRLVRGEKIANIEAIADPNYVTPTPEPTPSPVESASPTPVVTPTAKVEEAPQPVSPSPTNTTPAAVKPDSVIPVVVPVPVKVTPEAIAPVKVAPVINRVVPITEPVKAAPAKVKAIEPIKVEPIKVAPVVKPAPIVEPIKKYAPVVKPAPIVEPVKAKPVIVNSVKSPAIAAPISKEVAPSATPSPKPERVFKPIKEPAPDKVTSGIEDYFKNFSFNRQVSPETDKPAIAKPEEKSAAPVAVKTLETKLESKSTDNTPALTDLSTTTSTKIKVLNR
jgi:hypothetical protein